MACGGQVAEDEVDGAQASSPGVGGSTTTPNGGGGTTTTTTAAPMCWGKPAQPPTFSFVTLDYKELVGKTGECAIGVPVTAGLSLVPSMVQFYFPASDGTRTEIPYVGTSAGCSSSTAYGGWYASSLTGSSSGVTVGLCECTCNVAHKTMFKLDIDQRGIKLN